VQAALREKNIGVEVGGFRVPIVPAAILFDLRNGGDKDWGRYPPYRELGYEAAQATTTDFPLGTVGAGTGALTSGLKGGLGSASTMLDSGVTIGALAAVNPTGSVTVGRSRHFWAAPFEIGDEFGGLGYPDPIPEDARKILLKYRDRRAGEHPEGASTTIAVIATDAVLSKSAAKRLAISAHDGFARAIWPTHTPADGDLVFALATGRSGIELSADAAIDLYTAAGSTMARAISRGVHAATPADGDLFPVWSSR
ncbi:P1 family peptidase, partial [Mesorhizobium sp.]